MFNNIYKNKHVIITGHTGFKGSWLALWLLELGDDVAGFALPPNTEPNHFELIGLKNLIHHIEGDIRDLPTVIRAFDITQPEIVFHLAAQPLVRESYYDPKTTFDTNIGGTVNVLEAVRHCDTVKVAIVVTSDKCYENKEWIWGYRENDPMGGYDPYSASKVCAELVTSAYRNSFFNLAEYGRKHYTLLASARAGNVIGGGDWAKDRIITDMMKAVRKGENLSIRNPRATRPWQHVLEPLSGYLLLGRKLLEGEKQFAEAWNFGPNEDGAIPVLEMVNQMRRTWNRIDYQIEQDENNPHEAGLLKLDCSKARMKLNWEGAWDSWTTFAKTAEWYQCYYEDQQIITEKQLNEYVSDAGGMGLAWVN